MSSVVTAFASAKIRRPLLAWLKVEAARKGVPMYKLLEHLVAKAVHGRHWEHRRG
jgi:hypothetical protein